MKKGFLNSVLILIVLVIVLIHLVIINVESSPAIIYVPNNYPTIQAAVDAASPGDTLIIRAGIYSENILVNKDHLTIKSESSTDSTVVNSPNGNAHVFEITADYVEISGIKIEGVIGFSNLTTWLEPNYGVGGQAGIYLNEVHFCKIFNSIFVNSDMGVLIANSSNNLIIGNYFSGEGENMGGGIYTYLALSNTIKDNSFQDFWFTLWFNDSNTNLIKNNSIMNTTSCIYFIFSIDNIIYLNNFESIFKNINFASSPNIWNSPEEITYSYNDNTYASYLGNYWNDYSGSDVNGDGIGDIPYSIDSDNDIYPLIEPFENYVSEWDYPVSPYNPGSYNGRLFYFDNNHLGEDIELPERTPIYAIGPGVVKVLRPALGYGELVVVVEHDLGKNYQFTNAYGQIVRTRYILSIYGHLRKRLERHGRPIDLRVGSKVNKNTIIGYVNNSSHPDGGHPDPNGDGLEHLHMGIRLSDALTAIHKDPRAWFRGYEGNTTFGENFAAASEVIKILKIIS